MANDSRKVGGDFDFSRFSAEQSKRALAKYEQQKAALAALHAQEQAEQVAHNQAELEKLGGLQDILSAGHTTNETKEMSKSEHDAVASRLGDDMRDATKSIRQLVKEKQALDGDIAELRETINAIQRTIKGGKTYVA